MNITGVAAHTIRDRAHDVAGGFSRVLGNGIDPSDPSNRDPEFIERTVLPVFRFLSKYYFRVEAEGLENIPQKGPFLVVSNHNGGPILPDTWTSRLVSGRGGRSTRGGFTRWCLSSSPVIPSA